MQRSRTIKTLVYLVVAMSVGTFALQVLETKPAGDGMLSPLTATYQPVDPYGTLINATAVPVNSEKWANIIIHDSACGDITDFGRDCHFIVYGPLSADAGLDGISRSTVSWQRQSSGQHIFVPGSDYNSNSISICIEGDLVTQKPSTSQKETLYGLIRSLQRKFNISADRVYLHSELTGKYCPGEALTSEMLHRRLLR